MSYNNNIYYYRTSIYPVIKELCSFMFNLGLGDAVFNTDNFFADFLIFAIKIDTLQILKVVEELMQLPQTFLPQVAQQFDCLVVVLCFIQRSMSLPCLIITN